MNHSVKCFFTHSIPLLKTSAYCYSSYQTMALIKTPAHCQLSYDAGFNLLKFKIKSFPFVQYNAVFINHFHRNYNFSSHFKKNNLNNLVSEKMIADDDDLRRKNEFDHLRQTDFEVGDFFFGEDFSLPSSLFF